MSSGVKTIFKTLIGTAVAVVVISLVIEMLNISLYGVQLQQITKTALNQSLVLFSQETYKPRDSYSSSNFNLDSEFEGGTSDIGTLVNCDGTDYITGNFYGYDDPIDIYNSLYKSTRFKDWMSTYGTQGNWYVVNLINQYLNNPLAFPVRVMPTMDPDNLANMSETEYENALRVYEEAIEKYTEFAVAESYVNNMVTPLNFGIPYVDIDVVQRMFQWNLAMLMGNCSADSIINFNEYDPTANEYCVRSRGFLIFADQARITNVSYQVFDVEDPDQKTAFKNLTHIDPDNLGFEDSITYLGSSSGDERKRICVVSAEYSVPIRYVGISPLKSIFDFAWSHEVEGMHGANTKTPQTFNYDSDNLTGGGFNGNSKALDAMGNATGVLPVPGKLLYYVVR